jgi:hypothetical protein
MAALPAASLAMPLKGEGGFAAMAGFTRFAMSCRWRIARVMLTTPQAQAKRSS